MPKGGLEPPRVTSHAPQTCASTSSATSARSGRMSKTARPAMRIARYFFVGLGEAVITVENGIGVGSAALAGEDWGVGVGVDCGNCSGTPDCSTELVPLMAGNERLNAMNMKAAAAPIVIFAMRVCVPRGPKAVLETELVNSAPASALPG